jgi:transposase-like protein
MKKHIKCINCNSLRTQRHGVLNRQNKDSLQRFKCLDCSKTFTLGCSIGSRLTKAQKIKITKTHLEGRTSIRQIKRDTGFAKQTISNAIDETVSNCASSAWIAHKLKPHWGNCLAVDASYIRVWDWSAKHFRYTKNQKRFLHKLVWIVALDLKTLDIVHHHLGDEESMIDLIMFYEQVKKNGYDLKGLVSDGNTDIKRAARRIFKTKFTHQLCIRHYMQNLRAKLKEEILIQDQYQNYCQDILAGRPNPKLPKELFSYKTIPDLPRTNQQIENLFRQTKLRLKSISQFNSITSASNYLNAWTLMRRFTAFTDSRDPAKNKKSPLELAGCDITKINYLDLKTHS